MWLALSFRARTGQATTKDCSRIGQPRSPAEVENSAEEATRRFIASHISAPRNVYVCFLIALLLGIVMAV
ncbi:hypothetical protein [Burkholderia sp. Ac-20353]|uniref:hypothetical protein n=1 Tax=Burkholderia sp. Ac-20353 TaxID=2703894 RepID=UPI00197B4E81|nr:hypothetical protein [Burkholderia sp. Ac-20353]MBN3785999.1 hypothetical protein [Burkholderia sp. Ac-20353]